MSIMRAYPWLNNSIMQWQQNKIIQMLPHAILLTGNKGTGKIELANQMAHIAVCDNVTESGACLKCPGCQLFVAGNHTDVKTIRAEKSVIKVAQIRELSKDIMLSSGRNQYRVAIIENAEQMNSASANAILKTLEEPPKDVIIILTTNEIGSILATIQSRCFKLNIQTPSLLQTSNWLTDKSNYSVDEINFSLTLTSGSPILSESILANGTIQTIKSMLDNLQQINSGNITILDVSKLWVSQDLLVHLNYLAAYFLAVIKNINLGSNQCFTEYSGIQFSINDKANTSAKLLIFIKRIFKFIKLNETGIKTELLLDELLVNWYINFKIDSN